MQQAGQLYDTRTARRARLAAMRRLIISAEASVGGCRGGGAAADPAAAAPPASPSPSPDVEASAAAAASAEVCWVLGADEGPGAAGAAQRAMSSEALDWGRVGRRRWYWAAAAAQPHALQPLLKPSWMELVGPQRIPPAWCALAPAAAADTPAPGAAAARVRQLQLLPNRSSGGQAAQGLGRQLRRRLAPQGSCAVVPAEAEAEAEAVCTSLSVQNYAYGGATSCAAPGISVVMPDLMQQVDTFLQSAPASAARACDGRRGPCRAARDAGAPPQPGGRLFVVWVGHNDPLYWGDVPVAQQIVANITACRVAALDRLMQGLAAASSTQDNADGGGPGAATPAAASRDQIVVWPLAFIDFMPAVPEWARPFVRRVIDAHNAGLRASLEPLRARHPQGPSLQVYDVHAAVSSTLENAAQLGFSEASSNCLQQQMQVPTNSMFKAIGTVLGAPSVRCADPDEHLWFEGLHPTSRFHLLGVAQPFAQSTAWRQ
ncbi:hypothetical protein TSOC_006696 [Tetrabaena socialis]|uniref:GDSL esterase/lipase n=1 Tax=Tetrabaena socialis TaxID=47790 RepID=A0A2J8A306_9CHLO|nr:hypothetical protein TSOC_006696 [Tetrabaena socialis]|eukprot:PNH06896.1 hypothetical protein TSOC_006696 [Tetrabaena socialis]